jgi:hypothetical protein
MKSTLLCLLIASAFALPAADAPSLTGKWQVFTSIAGNDSDMACTFTQKDADLTGSCATQRGNVDIAGKVTGEKVAFSYKSEYNGNPLTIEYSGAKDSETTLKGNVNVPEYGVGGEFSASRHQ